MTTLARYLEKYPNSKEALILKSILANRPTEKTADELRQIRREEKLGKDAARWLAGLDRQKSAAGRFGGDC